MPRTNLSHRLCFLVICMVSFGGMASMSGCAMPARTVTQLRAADTAVTEGYWRNGTWVMTRIRPEYGLALAYRGMSGERLEFDLTFINRSKKTFDFNPSAIQLAYADTSLRPLNNAAMTDSIVLEYERERLNANPYAPSGIELGLGLAADITYLAATLAGHQETPEERSKRLEVEADAAERRASAAQWSSQHANRLGDLGAQRDFWSKIVLGRTTALPGDTLSGLLIFPRRCHTGPVEIICPMPAREERFQFNQTEVLLDPPRDTVPKAKSGALRSYGNPY